MSAPVVESVAPRWVRRAQGFTVVTVALVAACGSYSHMRELAAAVGEDWRAWLLPISVDGMILSASLTMFVRRRAGLRGGTLAWFTFLTGLGASLAANVASAEPTLQAQLVAAVYPVAWLLVTELAMEQINPVTRQVPASSQPEQNRDQPTLQSRIADERSKQDLPPLAASPAPARPVEASPPRTATDLADLLPVAREVVAEHGRVPGWKVMAAGVRARGHGCGTPKAQALVAALKAEQNGHVDVSA